jgi:glyoxylase-like metal-dependent hydrolase (beta-lactamase superfamily II)
MLNIHHFIFNDFLENTYVIWDETHEAVIIDPGCYYENEKEDLKKFIAGKSLKPVLLLNTHCHIDHIFGNKWVKDIYGIDFFTNQKEVVVLNTASGIGKMYGLYVEPSPAPDRFLDEGDEVRFGQSVLKVLFTPGHSPGSISFYASGEKFLVGGDVLFQSSIGRTDLPGGDYETLMQSIFNKVLVLPDEVTVHSGHGPATTIGEERANNPFILEYAQEVKR